MMQTCKKLWRESASLLILGKNLTESNYKVVVMERSNKASHLPSLSVFPGGTLERNDESKDWLEFYRSIGIPMSKFNELLNIRGPRPFIFQPTDEHSIAREISLRICAIRETFEEVGLLICKSQEQFQQSNSQLYANIITNINIHDWQKKVHNDPQEFLKMCQSLRIAPDLWSLSEWSAWLTPAFFTKRFNTAFFLVTLNTQPAIIKNQNEVDSTQWRGAQELLDQFKLNEIILTAPQIYELNRLRSIQDIDEIAKYARDRNDKGLELLFAVNYKTKDKNISTFPGDDFYPMEPDFYCINPKQAKLLMYEHETAAEFRKRTKNLHRMEYSDGGSGNDWSIYINVRPSMEHIPVMQLVGTEVQAKL